MDLLTEPSDIPFLGRKKKNFPPHHLLSLWNNPQQKAQVDEAWKIVTSILQNPLEEIPFQTDETTKNFDQNRVWIGGTAGKKKKKLIVHQELISFFFFSHTQENERKILQSFLPLLATTSLLQSLANWYYGMH
jgi:hypothetical protein